MYNVFVFSVFFGEIMKELLLVLEIIGTVAFAASGAMVAIKKGMDVFGVIVLGLTTAVGGGAIRDIILGQTPPAMFLNPIYALIATGVSIILFLPFIQKYLKKSHKVYDLLMIIADAIGLGVFSVVGVSVAISVDITDNLFLTVFVGVITGVGGGVIRDLFAGQTPFIFVKYFYASASIIGTLASALLVEPLGASYALIIGAVLIICLRLLAAYFHWSLPKAHAD